MAVAVSPARLAPGCAAFASVSPRPWRARTQPRRVFVEVAGEGFDHAVVHAPVLVADQADQVPVVRDHHDRAVEIAERLGQRLAHVEVEVVGRFVEQQQVRASPGDQRQRQPRLLAAAEGVDDLERAVAGEVPLAEEIAQFLVGDVGRELAQVVERSGAGDQRFHRVLGEVADAQVRMRLAFAGQGRQFADQGLHQRRLARAVGAEQADAVAGLEPEVDAAEDDCGAG